MSALLSFVVGILLVISCVSIYRSYSKKYAEELLVRFNDIKESLNEDEKNWLETHIQYLDLITEDKALCNYNKIRSKLLRDLEFATYCGLFSGDSYNFVYKAITRY